LSSGEAEFYGMGTGAACAIQTQQILSELKIPVKILLHADATAAMGMARRSGSGRVRHMEVKYLWLQAKVREGLVSLKKEAGTENIADLGTKEVTKAVHYHLMGKLPVGAPWSSGLPPPAWLQTMIFSLMMEAASGMPTSDTDLVEKRGKTLLKLFSQILGGVVSLVEAVQHQHELWLVLQFFVVAMALGFVIQTILYGLGPREAQPAHPVPNEALIHELLQEQAGSVVPETGMTGGSSGSGLDDPPYPPPPRRRPPPVPTVQIHVTAPAMPTRPPPLPPYEEFTRDALRELCRARGLSATGLKAELARRLLLNDHARSSSYDLQQPQQQQQPPQ
jgi:hypothetical protein